MTPEAATTPQTDVATVAPQQATRGALRWFLRIGRVVLGGVFLYAVFAKLNYPEGNFATFEWSNWKLAIEIFAIAVNGYGVLPDWAVTPVAYTVPLIETVLAILLIAGLWLRWSATAASALLLFFFSIMLRAYFLGMAIDCGCFGPGDTLSLKTLARDGALVALALGLTFAAFKLSPQRTQRSQKA